MGFGIALVAVSMCAFATTFLGYMGLLGKLPPNRWAGIRTTFTRANKENWYSTHRAAAPVMMFGGILALSISLAFVPFAFADKLSVTVSTAILALTGAIVLLTVAMAWYAGTAFAAARATAGGGEG